MYSYYNRSRHASNACLNFQARAVGAGGACPPLDFGRFVNPISTRGADYARLNTTCPPPRIFRPSYGPASYGITDTDSSTNFEGFELDTNWTYYVCTLVLYFSTFLARVDLWSLWSDLLRSWLSAVLRMTLLCTLLVLVFCVFAVLDFKLTFSYRPQSNLMCP